MNLPNIRRTPEGKGEVLLDVPNANLNWQLYYELETPRQIPAGSKATFVTLVVNSAKNRYDPATEPAAGALAVFLPADDRS